MNTRHAIQNLGLLTGNPHQGRVNSQFFETNPLLRSATDIELHLIPIQYFCTIVLTLPLTRAEQEDL